MMNKVASRLALLLLLMQLLLVVASWIVSSVTDVSVRSLLSSEGIRWFFGHFTEGLASPLLVWLLLLSLAFGAFSTSGLAELLLARSSRRMAFRQRYAVWMALTAGAAYFVVIVLLTCVPHAVLLSSTGRLFPSSFSASLVPVIAFGITLVSVVYGVSCRRYASVEAVFVGLGSGIVRTLPLWLLYVIGMQLWCSARFVLG